MAQSPAVQMLKDEFDRFSREASGLSIDGQGGASGDAFWDEDRPARRAQEHHTAESYSIPIT